MARFIHVGFNPFGPPKTKELEPWFAQLGDWIRYSATAWIVWTDYSPQQIFDYLKPAVHPDDQFIIVPLEPSSYQGWMPKWVWDWIQSKQSPLGLLGGGLGMINTPPGALGALSPPNPLLPNTRKPR